MTNKITASDHPPLTPTPTPGGGGLDPCVQNHASEVMKPGQKTFDGCNDFFLSCLNSDRSYWSITTESGLKGYRIPCLIYHVKDNATALKVSLQQMTRMIVLGTKMFVG